MNAVAQFASFGAGASSSRKGGSKLPHSRAALARRIERPRIALAGRGPGVEIQRDLEKLLAASLIEQALFFRSVRGELLEAASESFRRGVPGQVESGQWKVAGKIQSLAERIARLLVAAQILGRAQVRREAGLKAAATVQTSAASAPSALKDVAFGELDSVGAARVVEHLRSLDVMTRAQWEAAIQAQRARAFTIAGVNQAKALESMRELIAHSLEAGLTPAQFDAKAADLLRNFEVSQGKLRTVWNTNVAQAMTRAREEELRSPEVRSVVSWRLFDAMLDQFTRPNHAALEGALAPAEWWDGPGANLKPLLGFNCRCVLISVTAARAEKWLEQGGKYFDIREGIPQGAGPDPGWSN